MAFLRTSNHHQTDPKDHPMKSPVKYSFFLPALIAGLNLMLPDHVLAQSFATLYNFSAIANSTNGDGAEPVAGLILAGNTLYGTAAAGGSAGNGTVFAINTNGTGFASLHDFAGSPGDGDGPAAGLILAGGTLYGTANQGGSTGNGAVFEVNTNGLDFATFNFSGGSDGAYPDAGLVLSGGTLYGTASQGGGPGNDGTVFAISTNGGTGFITVHTFTEPSASVPATNSDGAFPNAGLILSGNTLYGTASAGGGAGSGTVFKVNTDGSGFTTLHSFTATSGSDPYPTNSDGASPQAGLVLSGNTLYGTAAVGGGSGRGVVFAINTDGTGFTNLHAFSAVSDGANPYAGLVWSGGTLYGTAVSGGSSDHGTVFAVNTDGSDFTNLHSFTAFSHSTNSDGASPYAGLVLSANLLYGTASAGGGSGSGTVFSLALIPPVVTQLVYTTNNGAITITGYTGTNSAVTIPGSINGLPVTGIGSDAFYNKSSLAGVTLPGSVTSIGADAFFNCKQLTNVVIPASVTTLGNGAFSASGLTSVTLPGSLTNTGTGVFFACYSLASVVISNGVTGIGLNTFYACSSLGSVTFPNSVAEIGGYAFYGCESLTNVTLDAGLADIDTQAFYNCGGLPAITIPGSVTNIGYEAFDNCSRLTAITVDSQNALYSSAGGVLFDKNQTNLIQYPAGLAGAYAVPGTVTTIGDDAFFGSAGLTNVVIPGSVTSLGNEVFSESGLTSITLPQGLAAIGDNLFAWCSALASVTIPASVSYLGDNAFEGCSSLTAVYFAGNPPGLGNTVFDSDSPATLYYLPGNSSYWNATFDGLPTAVWVVPPPPISITTAGNLPVVVFPTATGANYVVQMTTNLASGIWVTVTNGIPFSGLQITNAPGTAFFRLH